MRLVVVMAPLTLLTHKEREVTAARFEGLGLTAYGRTESEAILSLKKLFNKFIHFYRSAGQLKHRLNELDVEWYWADEYPEDLPHYEDTNDLMASQPSRDESGFSKTAVSSTWMSIVRYAAAA